MLLLMPGINPPLSFIASWAAITSKGAVYRALDSKNSIDLVDSFFIDLQPLIGQLRVS